jgi:hypothetical protein
MSVNKKIKLLFFLMFMIFAYRQSFAQTTPNSVVEGAVKFYFSDIPIMIDIAKCETNFRQYNDDGSAYYDASHTYVGVFQIAEDIHSAKAASMGFDIKTIDGNLQYARYLYNTSGTNPWKGCLPKQTPPPTTTPTVVSTTPAISTPQTSLTITANLRIGMTNPQILVLQQLLNKNGFKITESGPGSPGSETNFFGSLTRLALQRFQCAKAIVCTGSEANTGYGRVGPKTKAALNALPN